MRSSYFYFISVRFSFFSEFLRFVSLSRFCWGPMATPRLVSWSGAPHATTLPGALLPRPHGLFLGRLRGCLGRIRLMEVWHVVVLLDVAGTWYLMYLVFVGVECISSWQLNQPTNFSVSSWFEVVVLRYSTLRGVDLDAEEGTLPGKRRERPPDGLARCQIWGRVLDLLQSNAGEKGEQVPDISGSLANARHSKVMQSVWLSGEMGWQWMASARKSMGGESWLDPIWLIFPYLPFPSLKISEVLLHVKFSRHDFILNILEHKITPTIWAKTKLLGLQPEVHRSAMEHHQRLGIHAHADSLAYSSSEHQWLHVTVVGIKVKIHEI